MIKANDINKVFINSSLSIEKVNVTTLLFDNGIAKSKTKYSISDHVINLVEASSGFIDLYENIDSSFYYEYEMALNKENTKIRGGDRFESVLDNLDKTVIVFINGIKLKESEYTIDVEDKSITILDAYKDKARNTIIIYISDQIVYKGNVKDASSWNPDENKLSLYDYTHLRYMFFKNGKLINRNKLQYKDGYLTINEIIDTSDVVDFYRFPLDTISLEFETTSGYTSYGPRDNYDYLVPNIYDSIATFDDVVRLLIDNVRTGMCIREVDGDGCLVIVDTDFEKNQVQCILMEEFSSKVRLSQNEFFIEAPEARSILNYSAAFDKNSTMIVELLTVFQRFLLDEVYDSIQRLKDIRDISRVDSGSISQLIDLLGIKFKITNMNLRQKHNLLEELCSFYRIVGTKPSLNFYNAINNQSQRILKIDQLFTPIKDDQYNQRYISFKTPEELGATVHQEYVIPKIDYGTVDSLANQLESLKNTPRSSGELEESPIEGMTPLTAMFNTTRDVYIINDEGEFEKASIETKKITYLQNPKAGPNTPTVDYGYITDDPVSFYDYGSVATDIEGYWDEWTEWERDKNWYPTNHVEISLELPAEIDYAVFMEEFSKIFYNIASTVIYIHSIIQSYTFGEDKNNTYTDKEKSDIKMSILGGPMYNREIYTFTNDPARQPGIYREVNPLFYELLNGKVDIINSKVIASVDIYTTYDDGEVRNFDNEIIGYVDKNKNVKEEKTSKKIIGNLRDEWVYTAVDTGNRIIGYANDDRSIVNNNDEVIGILSKDCIKYKLAVENTTSDILGYINNYNDVINLNCEKVGYVSGTDILKIGTGDVIGTVSEEEVSLAISYSNSMIGYVTSDNIVINEENEQVGTKDDDNIIYDLENNKIGNANETDEIYSLKDPTKLIGHLGKYSRVVRSDTNKILGVDTSSLWIENITKEIPIEITTPAYEEIEETDTIYDDPTVKVERLGEEAEKEDGGWKYTLYGYKVDSTVKFETTGNEYVDEWLYKLPIKISYTKGEQVCSILKIDNDKWKFIDEKIKIEKEREEKTETKTITYYSYDHTMASNIEDVITSGNIESHGKKTIMCGKIIIKDVDYLIIQYKWTKGSDLDSYTRLLNAESSVNRIGIGWYSGKNSYVPSNSSLETGIISWGGDNTGTGSEYILVNTTKLQTDYEAYMPENHLLKIDLRAAWYGPTYPSGTPESNEYSDVYIVMDAYKNGTVEHVGTSFVIQDGELKDHREELTYNVYRDAFMRTGVGSKASDETLASYHINTLATITINTLTKDFEIEITPKQ